MCIASITYASIKWIKSFIIQGVNMYEGRKTMINKVMSFNSWIATIMFEKGNNIKDNIGIKYAKVMITSS